MPWGVLDQPFCTIAIGARWELPTFRTRRAVIASLRHAGTVGTFWIVRVSRGLVADVKAKSVAAHLAPLGLVTRDCACCGEPFALSLRGRPSTFCPSCRDDRRRGYFAERARQARA